jgi:hypothetical protein
MVSENKSARCRNCKHWNEAEVFEGKSFYDWGVCKNAAITRVVAPTPFGTNEHFGCIGFEAREFPKM